MLTAATSDIKIVVDADGIHSVGTAIGQGDIDCVKIMHELRANAPEALDTIIFEIEQPLNGRTIQEGTRTRTAVCQGEHRLHAERVECRPDAIAPVDAGTTGSHHRRQF